MYNHSVNLTTKAYLTLVNHFNQLPVLILVIMIGTIVCAFNFLTISIILCSKKLWRPCNFPIINILVGAALQSLFTFPAYIFNRLDKKMAHHVHEPWMCNLYRFPYFLCGDILRISFVLVSFDRLIAVKYPFTYRIVITKKLYTGAIITIWTVVSLIDIIPFLPLDKNSDDQGCTYIPEHGWNLCVILAFNIVPFVTTAYNYVTVWRFAAYVTATDRALRKSMSWNSQGVDNSKGIDCIINESFSYGNIQVAEEENRPPDDNESTSSGDFNNDQTNVFNRKKSYMCAIKSTNNGERHLPEILPESLVPEVPDIRINDHEDVMCCGVPDKIRVLWEMKATKNSAVLLSIYLICWTPLGMYNLIDNLCSTWLSGGAHEHTYIDQFVLKGVSFFSSIFVPLVYCWQTKLFRKELQRFAKQHDSVFSKLKDFIY